jgi:DNA-binding MarR family transcriptional regulator
MRTIRTTGATGPTDDLDDLDDLTVSLQRLGRLLASRQAASRITAAAGVDVGQQGAALLRVLLRTGRTAIATLAASTPMEIAAVSRQIRILEQVGAVRRSPSPDDGRVALVELTPEGRRMAERIRAVGLHHLREALAGWSETDERSLARLLGRLVDDLEATPVPPISQKSKTGGGP